MKFNLEDIANTAEQIKQTALDYIPLYGSQRLRKQNAILINKYSQALREKNELEEKYKQQIAVLEKNVIELEKNTIDDLTSLPHRGPFVRKLTEGLKDYFRTGKYFAIVFCDPAGTRYANGNNNEHWDEGSKLIKVTGGIVRQEPSPKSEDEETVRYAGDEFAKFKKGNRKTVVSYLKVVIKDIRARQKFINNRPEEERKKFLPFVDGEIMEICIGYGVVTSEYMAKHDYLPKPGQIPESQIETFVNEIMEKELITRLGAQLASKSKENQGIYVRHDKYNRKPNGHSAKILK